MTEYQEGFKDGLDLALQHVEAQKVVWKCTDIPPGALLDMLVRNLHELHQWRKGRDR